MASFRAKLVRWITGAYLSRIDSRSADVGKSRRRWRAVAKRLQPLPEVSIETTTVFERHAEWLTPPGALPGTVLLYLHGGAYIMGDCTTHRQMVSYIARAAGMRALLPEYRLAPEHRFPAAVDDAVGIYRALLAENYDPARIIVAGDSAGGGLTMALLLSLRAAGDPLPAATCLLSPWTDLALTGKSMYTHADRDPWFRPEDLPPVVDYYCSADQRRQPLVSPLYADLGGLPPILIQVGEDEILLSDSTRAAAKIEAAGGQVEIDVWPGMWHVFQMFVQQVPESRRAIDKLGAYMRRALGEGGASES